MTKPAAFRAIYSDWKLIKTRSTVQVVLEIPVEDADAAYEVLGGMPVAGKERWFGIAAIKPEETQHASAVVNAPAKPDQEPLRPDRARRDWRDLPPAQQAGIRCEEPAFGSFLAEERPDDFREVNDAADCVRLICGITSRRELNTNQKARVIWHQLNDQYEAWVRVGA